MGCVYFIRHGESVWNVEDKICGTTDVPLTEKGHRQAIQTGQRILEQGIHADEILYSPLMRAAETARHIAEITGIPARVVQSYFRDMTNEEYAAFGVKNSEICRFVFENAPAPAGKQAAVFLEDLADAFESGMDGWSQFLNTETGEIIELPDVDNDYIDLEEEDEEMYEEIEESDKYVRLPNQYELHEYHIMENFAEATEKVSRRNAERLFRALNGRKPYRHFKDTINELGIEEQYYAFRFLAFCEKAREWCEYQQIPYRQKE